MTDVRYEKLFKNYRFRCSGLPKLMVEPRTKNGPLSETTKSYLRELWIREIYGRDRSFQTMTKYTQKGTMVESDSLDLYKKATRKTYFKNNVELKNRYITGTPDVIRPLIDIKSSWDLWTFAAVTEKDALQTYYWQLLGYAWLTKQDKGTLVYALCNTPEILISDELYILSRKIATDNTDQYRKNFIFDDISPKERIKKFTVKFSKKDIDALRKKIIICREYMATIRL